MVAREVEHGLAAQLKKPFTPTALLEAVRKSLEHAGARAR
jgi:hypothetical protein